MSQATNKAWEIPVIWEMCGTVWVEAPTLAEAMKIAEDKDNVLPLPEENYYVDGSWHVSNTDCGTIRACYNNNQSDA